MATTNDARGPEKYHGVFDLDPALVRRFTLTIPVREHRPTPGDRLDALVALTGSAPMPDGPGGFDDALAARCHIESIPMEPLAVLGLLAFSNLDRCVHTPSRLKVVGSQEVCTRSACRVLQASRSLCPMVGAAPLAALIHAKRPMAALAMLRVARTARLVEQACSQGSRSTLEQLQAYAETNCRGEALYEAVLRRYLTNVKILAPDVRALLPFVLLEKMPVAEAFVTQSHQGNLWLATKQVVTATWERLETLIRENSSVIKELTAGNGALQKLEERLDQAETTFDPALAHAIGAMLARRPKPNGDPSDIACRLQKESQTRDLAKELAG